MRLRPVIPGVGGAAATILEDLEAFVRDSHVADLDLGPQGDNVDDLERELARVDVGTVDVVGEEGNAEGAKMGDRGEVLEEEVLHLRQDCV